MVLLAPEHVRRRRLPECRGRSSTSPRNTLRLFLINPFFFSSICSSFSFKCMPYECVIAHRFSRVVRATRRAAPHRREISDLQLRDLQVAKVRPRCDNNGDVNLVNGSIVGGARGRRSSARFMSCVDSTGVYVYGKKNAGVWSPFLPTYISLLVLFPIFGPFDPPSSRSLSISPPFCTLAFLSVLKARLSLHAAISTVVLLSLRLSTVSRISRDTFPARYIKVVARRPRVRQCGRFDIKSRGAR